ncbi:peptidoglycan-binding protein [Alkalihalobacillus clausii]|nr:peptidoglycan-binding protein [Shouchella clausii]
MSRYGSRLRESEANKMNIAYEERRRRHLGEPVEKSAKIKGRVTMPIKLCFFFMSVLLFSLISVPEQADADSFSPIHEGEKSERVEKLQDYLVESGYLEDQDRSHTYDSKVVAAVKQFQQDNNLLVDGIAGVQTLGSMAVLQEGSDGLLVNMLQKKLAQLQYYQADIDGYYGVLTKAAVTAFQKQNGLAVDGIAGPLTFKALYYSEAEPAEQREKKSEKANENNNGVEKNESNKSENGEEENELNESTNGDVEQPTEKKEEEPANTASSTHKSEGKKTFQMEATAYTAYCHGCSGTTATGIDLRANPNQKVVAVDPAVIPLGSRVHVEGYGEAIAGDTGGAIKGQKIDLYMQSEADAYAFGRQQVTVTLLE